MGGWDSSELGMHHNTFDTPLFIILFITLFIILFIILFITLFYNSVCNPWCLNECVLKTLSLVTSS